MSGSKCPYLEGCPMFNKLRFEATKKILVNRYCLGDYTKCARYQMRSSGKVPPPNLLPSGKLI